MKLHAATMDSVRTRIKGRWVVACDDCDAIFVGGDDETITIVATGMPEARDWWSERTCLSTLTGGARPGGGQ